MGSVPVRWNGHVAGMGEAMQQAEEGLKLFKSEEKVQTDNAGAEMHKADVDSQFATLAAEVDSPTGKDHKKARSEKCKEIADLLTPLQCFDARKVVQGLLSTNGFFDFISGKAAEQVAPHEAPIEAPAMEQLFAKQSNALKIVSRAMA